MYGYKIVESDKAPERKDVNGVILSKRTWSFFPEEINIEGSEGIIMKDFSRVVKVEEEIIEEEPIIENEPEVEDEPVIEEEDSIESEEEIVEEEEDNA